MNSLYLVNQTKVNLDEVVYDESLSQQINDFLDEYEHREALAKYHLPVANKLFLFGQTGCGKTMTAKALANRLQKKIFIVNLSTIVSSRLGETAKNLSALFNNVSHKKAVLFFDEFDSLGSIRDYDNNDTSEMKRVVNTILQLIDDFPQDAILIGATNQIQLIDEAILRRFDLKLEFKNPSNEVLDGFYNQLLENYPLEYRKIDRKYSTSFAEAKSHVYDAVKKNIIAHEKAKLAKA
ncbi:AAA family ATPase [Crocinitomix algicola]|uniref:AAA family ATPase n=1 Tax=Crocinitomix algicola TaxID=1740263 RepID=UPI000872C8E1|nr:ATP-binding protein [Crocinitomix algicola]